MTNHQSSPQITTAVPLLKDNEARLVKMRKQLEYMFVHLQTVRDEIMVSAVAARGDGQLQLANVLSIAVASRLFYQLKLLKKIIARLGGAVTLPEEDELRQSPAQTGGAAPGGQ